MKGATLKNLRKASVLVLHPSDYDGQFLVEHLHRIGCRVEAEWPVPDTLRDTAPDIAIVSVSRETHRATLAFLRRLPARSTAVIAIVDYENPATLQLVLELDAVAVIGKPVRPFGLLTNLLLALSLQERDRAQTEEIDRLGRRLASQRRISAATVIVMERCHASEQEAYRMLREQAMAKRISLEKVAESLIQANDLLQGKDGEA